MHTFLSTLACRPVRSSRRASVPPAAPVAALVLVAALGALPAAGLAAHASGKGGNAGDAGDAGCKALLAGALARQLETPTHLYITESGAFLGGREEHSESIYAGGAIYVLHRGKWSRSPIGPEDLRHPSAAGQDDPQATTTCRYVRDETVNGDAAAVYSSHRRDPQGDQSDSTIWISKRRGLPLRLEVDIDTGGSSGKSHTSTRFDYDHVTRPPL